MNSNIFLKDDEGNTIFYKWGGLGKPYIVNDIHKQQKLEALINARDKLFDFTLGLDIGSILLFLILAPILFLFTPIVYITVLLGTPIFFALIYLVPSLSFFQTFGITLTIVFLIYIVSYSNKVNKIIQEDEVN